jgi:hypothetical protein
VDLDRTSQALTPQRGNGIDVSGIKALELEWSLSNAINYWANHLYSPQDKGADGLEIHFCEALRWAWATLLPLLFHAKLSEQLIPLVGCQIRIERS